MVRMGMVVGGRGRKEGGKERRLRAKKAHLECGLWRKMVPRL